VSPPPLGERSVAAAASRLFGEFRDGLYRAEHLYMVLVALAIGVMGGGAAVLFRLCIRFVNIAVWHQGPYTLEYLAALPAWWKLAGPAGGGLVVGLITYYFAREARGHGVPEVMEAVALRSGRIRPRVVVAKLFASAVCIGSGGSVGREGPIVQVGSALGSTIGQWLRIDPRRLRTLVGCGAAAGIAATFNAPVAGALFAVEIILGDFGVSQFSPIVISSVMATVVSHRFLGDFPAFVVPDYRLAHASELVAYVGLGVLAGLVAIAFIRVLYGLEDAFERVPGYPPLKSLAGGLLVGIIGLWAPHVFGVGYEAIDAALLGTLSWYFMLALVALKILAVSITIGSGGSGGVFAPSLFIGAMLGGAVGAIVDSIWPAATGGVGAYALVGMGAVVAAGTNAPITAILIIFELTGDYAIILPLMVSCIIATLLSTQLLDASIYTLKLRRRGVDIHRGRAVNVLDHVPVTEIMRHDVRTVSPREGLPSLLGHLIDRPGATLFVTDERRRLLGLVTAEQVQPVMRDPAALEGLVIAEDVMLDSRYPCVASDRSVADVMRLLGDYRGEIPVVEGDRLVGVIWPEDVLDRYNTEVFKRDMVGGMAAAVGQPAALAPVAAAEDAVVAEVTVPRDFVGRTLRELDVRKRYHVSVLMVKHIDAGGTERLDTSPAADYRFRDGDMLLVLGSQPNVEALERARS